MAPRDCRFAPAATKGGREEVARTVRDPAQSPPTCVATSTELSGLAGLAARFRQRRRRGRRIDEAAREQVEGQQLEQDGQKQHAARRGEDGERGDRLRQIDELLADLDLVL